MGVELSLAEEMIVFGENMITQGGVPDTVKSCHEGIGEVRLMFHISVACRG